MKWDVWVRQSRTSRGWRQSVCLFKDDGPKTFIAKPVELVWEECDSTVVYAPPPTFDFSDAEWNDLKQALTDPMKMHGIHVSQNTVETSLKETKAHLETVKAYADRLLTLIERKGI